MFLPTGNRFQNSRAIAIGEAAKAAMKLLGVDGGPARRPNTKLSANK